MVYYTDMKKALSLLTTAAILTIIGVGLWLIFGMLAPDQPAPSPAPQKPVEKPYVYVPKQDKDLLKVLLSVAKDDEFAKTIAIKEVDSFKDAGNVTTRDKLAGQAGDIFDKKGVNHPIIYVKSGLSTADKRRIVAHEYLHVAYGRIPNQDSVIKALKTLYDSDAAMQQRLADYRTDGYLVSEYFSYYCTESSDGYLSATVLKACNKMIDRSKLQFVR